ncbi:MAG: hypothetical protein HRT57_08280, partial [Crocinitomicaceae bacterium]|nr:hypothetical protein [Crocinitomicaceae bacterium]
MLQSKIKSLICLTVLFVSSIVYGQTTYLNSSTGQTGTIQTYIVPGGVTLIQIEAWGAQGGDQGGFTGGLGAYISGEFAVTPGETIDILVGQRGITGSGSASGGGGGSFVVRQTGNVPLLIAGGGSGTTDLGPNGNGGLAGNSGGAGDNCAGNGGTGGNGGGDAALCASGAGGAGG